MRRSLVGVAGDKGVGLPLEADGGRRAMSAVYPGLIRQTMIFWMLSEIRATAVNSLH